MSEAWLLFKVLFKNSMTLDLKTKKGRRGVVLMVVLALCFVPTLGMLYMSFLDAFRQGMLDTLMMEAGMLIPCALTSVMALMVVPTVFYFSRDTDLLLPLPVTADSIVLAKTGMILTSQVLVGTVMALPIFAAYWTVHPDILKILGSLLVLVTLPLLPVFILGLVMMVLMYVVPALRNKDRFNLVFGILTLIVAVGISTLSSSFGANPDMMAELMNNPEDLALINYVFPQIAWAARSVTTLGISDLCLYLGVTLLGLALFMFTARKLFLPAVTNMGSTTRKARSRGIEKEHPAWLACLLVENRMLLRTPAWFMNCLLPSFLIVIIFSAVFLIQGVPALLADIDLPDLTPWMPAIGIMTGLFVGSMSMITSTTFSREGQNLWRMKVIPVSMRTQILSRGLLGFLWSSAGCELFILVAAWLLKADLLDVLLMSAGSLVTNVFVNGLGLLTDGWHPHLIWDDDTGAVKNNFTAMIEMFVSWVVILLAVLPLILFGWAEHIFLYSAAWIGIFALIDLWMILKGPAVVARFLENQI
ncbi:hypothetical protein [Faecalibaculum rodentium]|uniref:hypothetical protein n=1 Tax=Faecalibaculum rodentium TaxID=1702221 RepID=UPI0023F22182|nr:hypothetical protein [Faecalibaculum rodentium]